MRLPDPLRRLLRWCRNGALCAALAYGIAGFLAVNLSRVPDGIRSSALLPPPGLAAFSGRPGTPPPPSGPGGYTVVRGALSVHTGRSHDAEGTLDEVARAARRTGLDFVVLGDHPGEWMDQDSGALDPQRRDGVLLVPGLELVISGVGRTLAVGLDTLPRRWEGSVEELTERARADGAFLSVVHPRSPRSRERWEGLDAPGVHAWESFDVSEMARARLKEPWAGYHLVSFLGGLAVGRGEGSLEALWRERTSTPALLSYDSARARMPVALTGGLNHHPKARLGGLLLPRYEPFFRTVVNHVLVPGRLPADPFEARSRVLASLKAGRLFVTLGEPGGADGFLLTGSTPSVPTVDMGGSTTWSSGSALQVRLPRDARGQLLVRILRDGREESWVEAEAGETLVWPAEAPGVYRVEVFRGGRRLGVARAGFRPWILSNPVEFYHGESDRLALNP